MAIGDLDGDGHDDLAVADYSGNVVVMLNDGSGAFSTVDYTHTINYAASVAIGNFDHANQLDLAVVSHQSGSPIGSLVVLLSDGLGGHNVSSPYTVGSYPAYVASGDLDGSGWDDLAVEASSYVSIFFNTADGTGGFNDKYDRTLWESGGTALAIGNLFGNGRNDLVSVQGVDRTLIRNDGGGVFTTAGLGGGASSGRSVAIADFDLDGNKDLALAGNYDLRVQSGDGTGGWERDRQRDRDVEPPKTPKSSAPYSISTSEFASILIVPFHWQLQVESSDSAAVPSRVTLLAPGDQAAVITGLQGAGAPWAACTAGFMGDLHIPNGGMLVSGW